MKKIAFIAGFVSLLVGGAVLAQNLNGAFDLWSAETKASKRKALVLNVPLYVGPALGSDSIIASSSNKVTRILQSAYTIDFATATITCNDSAGQTLTGAKVGDTCIVGPPAAAQANASFTCRVSAADTVIIRYCAAGTAADPASASYAVTVISNQ